MLFEKVVKDIKDLKIQGAENIAIQALKALTFVAVEKNTINIKTYADKLKNARPTEPMMHNLIDFYCGNLKKGFQKDLLNKLLLELKNADEKISNYASVRILSKKKYYTHCHSSTVIKTFERARLIEKKVFEVHNTETRPLFQGRITATELAKMGVKVKHFIDSAARLAIKDCSAIFLGADAILNDGKVINKIGSEFIAEIAEEKEIPVYIVASKWKFANMNSKKYADTIEQRSPDEVWKPNFKGSENVVVNNPAFEMIKPKVITAIITELGIMDPLTAVIELKKDLKKN